MDIRLLVDSGGTSRRKVHRQLPIIQQQDYSGEGACAVVEGSAPIQYNKQQI